VESFLPKVVIGKALTKEINKSMVLGAITIYYPERLEKYKIEIELEKFWFFKSLVIVNNIPILK
jgi:hypothetical protein